MFFVKEFFQKTISRPYYSPGKQVDIYFSKLFRKFSVHFSAFRIERSVRINFPKFICRKLFDARKARSPMQILFRPKQVTWSCQQAFRIDRSVGISFSTERLFDAHKSRSQMQILCVLSSLELSLWLVIAILNRGRPHGSNHCGCGCGSPEDLPIYFLENFLAF